MNHLFNHIGSVRLVKVKKWIYFKFYWLLLDLLSFEHRFILIEFQEQYRGTINIQLLGHDHIVNNSKIKSSLKLFWQYILVKELDLSCLSFISLLIVFCICF